jgi:DNA-binding winged helix-turn-helix (wHTH) protein/TolB-like protein/tetratricopeptide (TPR) repeat protein
VENSHPLSGNGVPGKSFRFGPYEVDGTLGEVRKHGFRIKLSGQPLEILFLLLERPGELVSREELRQRLWPEDIYVDFEHSLNSAVKKLRRALNDSPDQPRYIETHPRKGYRFISVVDQLALPKAESAEAPIPITSSEPEISRTSSGPAVAAVSPPAFFSLTHWNKIAALLVGAIVIFVMALRIGYRQRPQGTPFHAASSKTKSPRPTIAVLGFKNLSSELGNEWLSTAFTQMLSTELERGGKLRLIPEEQVARAKLDLGIQEKDGYALNTLRSVRTDLGTDYVVTGSYVVLGGKNAAQVRLDLRLQEAISGETLASIGVSGKQSEIFNLVVKAADELRTKMGATIPPEGDVDWRTVLPSNSDAARLYSEGLADLHRSENVRASGLFEQALSIEPDFALGHAALAEAWQSLGYLDRAQASAQKAFSLSTTLPEDERLKIEARYYELQHDWAGAIGAYRHLWQDYPDDIESGLRLAAVQTSASHADDALSTISNLRSLPAPQRDDPRIDLAEAAIASRNANYSRQQALARQAADKAQAIGARLLLARAKIVEGQALDNQSHFKDAIEAYSTAKQIFEDAGDRDGAVLALNALAIARQKQGGPVAASRHADARPRQLLPSRRKGSN